MGLQEALPQLGLHAKPRVLGPMQTPRLPPRLFHAWAVLTVAVELKKTPNSKLTFCAVSPVQPESPSTYGGFPTAQIETYVCSPQLAESAEEKPRGTENRLCLLRKTACAWTREAQTHGVQGSAELCLGDFLSPGGAGVGFLSRTQT